MVPKVKTPTNRKYFNKTKKTFQDSKKDLLKNQEKTKYVNFQERKEKKCKGWVISELTPIPYSKISKQKRNSLKSLKTKHRY